MKEIEEVIMEIIGVAGTARSHAMIAMRKAKKGDLEGAEECIKNASTELSKAHNCQTELIQGEAAGKKIEMSLLMVHAQDHLMNAITVKDMAKEFIDLYKKLT